jgi:hypothetical protein
MFDENRRVKIEPRLNEPPSQETTMNKHLVIIAGFALLCATGATFAQPVAGSTTLGVAVTEVQEVATGWSAKRQVMGKPVYNELNEKIGNVEDIIIAPDKSLSYAIVGAGGFLGVARHDVAIPVSNFKLNAGKLVLAGATKDAIKSMPPFEYAHS